MNNEYHLHRAVYLAVNTELPTSQQLAVVVILFVWGCGWAVSE